MEHKNNEGDGDAVLQPGQNIRPIMTESTARLLVKKLYGYDVTYITELNSYDDRNYFIKVSPEHTNPHEREVLTDGYVLKILNSLDTPKQHVAAEHEMQAVLRNKDIKCQRAILTVDGADRTIQTICYDTYGDLETKTDNMEARGESGRHLVRLMTYISGRLLVEVPYKPDLLYRSGKYVGAMSKCLAGFRHEVFESHRTIWSLVSVHQLSEFLFAVINDQDKQVVQSVIDAYEKEVVPLFPYFERGVIHGDCNEQNMLVRSFPDQGNINEDDKDYYVHAILDFGDAHTAYCVFDIAIHIMYMMVESKVVDPLEVGGYVLAGYLSERSLCEQEFDALKLLVAGRYCQSLVMGAYTYFQDPGNEYLLVTAKRGWPQLHNLWKVPKGELYKMWKDVISSYN